ncbi:SDR family oxidoreductase [Solimonas soli]|uniref:SDR family oxidoreductase n=1 Tax=Solimonas soli TaxID=413479 RepID=UPI0004BA3038|nr:SDR family oxidoreductase [Solimonas soli]
MIAPSFARMPLRLEEQRDDEARRAATGGALSGKVVVVTGGARGLGAAICRAVAAQGAVTVVGDLRAEGAERAAGALRERGLRATATAFDVGSEASVSAALATLAAEHGRIDALINNAGIDVTLPIEELSVAQWEAVLRTNLHGPFLTTKLALPYLRASQGQVINIASTAAKRAWPNAAAYHASKWGLLGLSHALHAELRGQGIRVTAIVAGGMRTPFLLDRFPDLDPELLQEPDNVAQAIVFALTLPAGSVVPEMTVLPMRETSWP